MSITLTEGVCPLFTLSLLATNRYHTNHETPGEFESPITQSTHISNSKHSNYLTPSNKLNEYLMRN